MAWAGAAGTGHLIMGSGMVINAIGSLTSCMVGSFAIASGFVVQTAANVGGSAAAIVGRPDYYAQVNFLGVDYLMPMYRKV